MSLLLKDAANDNDFKKWIQVLDFEDSILDDELLRHATSEWRGQFQETAIKALLVTS